MYFFTLAFITRNALRAIPLRALRRAAWHPGQRRPVRIVEVEQCPVYLYYSANPAQAAPAAAALRL